MLGCSMFNNKTLNLFSITVQGHNKEPLTTIPFVSAILVSKTSPIRLFHREQNLKTKLFLEISKVTLGRWSMY